MLVDIFARRYESQTLRDSFEQRDNRLLVQGLRILADDLRPIFKDEKENKAAVTFWTNLHNKISRELGLKELSPHWVSYKTIVNGSDHFNTFKNSILTVCENWMMQPISGSPDQHIKERLRAFSI